MKGKSKYVSNLDLKYLGAKFITIPDSHLDLNSNISDIRKSKEGDLPSILKGSLEYDETSLQNSSVGRYFHLQKIDYEASRRSSLSKKKEKVVDKNQYGEEQKKQIAKYRSLIKQIKQGNEILHREITNLYREKRLNDNQIKTKPIKAIFKTHKDKPKLTRDIRLAPEAKEYNQIYERLNSEENPYRKESLDIQKKLSASNLHKNFQNFLQACNRRVPDFIKNIR